ncbi:MAG: hypothetical protein HQM09_15045 [Candidatus Riflebacteria bacterium]|nr:hypothetical protein [Candidatus Riflebacteria bacterium]
MSKTHSVSVSPSVLSPETFDSTAPASGQVAQIPASTKPGKKKVIPSKTNKPAKKNTSRVSKTKEEPIPTPTQEQGLSQESVQEQTLTEASLQTPAQVEEKAIDVESEPSATLPAPTTNEVPDPVEHPALPVPIKTQVAPVVTIMKRNEIIADRKYQPRADDGSGALFEPTARDYSELKIELPPIEVAESDNPEFHNKIIAGHTRFRGYEIADRTDIPVIRRKINNAKEFVEAAVVSNLKHGLRPQRPDLIRSARMMDEAGHTRAEIAQLLHYSPAWVTDVLGPIQKEFSPEDRESILRDKGLNNVDAAKMLGVTPQGVSAARKKLEREDAALVAANIPDSGDPEVHPERISREAEGQSPNDPVPAQEVASAVTQELPANDSPRSNPNPATHSDSEVVALRLQETSGTVSTSAVPAEIPDAVTIADSEALDSQEIPTRPNLDKVALAAAELQDQIIKWASPEAKAMILAGLANVLRAIQQLNTAIENAAAKRPAMPFQLIPLVVRQGKDSHTTKV